MQKNAIGTNFTYDDFPELQSTEPFVKDNKSSWSSIVNKDPVNDNDASSHDRFEGYCDEQGSPIYGKINFANGNIYKGPVFSSFPQDVEIQDDESDAVFDFEDETIEYDRDPYENYGEMIYPDGTSFWGVFCFGKQVIDNLAKQ